MKSFRFSLLTILTASLCCHLSAESPSPAEGMWKTAFYKRGFVGKYQAKWAGGADGTGFLRQSVTLPFSGSKVRVWMSSVRDIDVTLGQMNLAPGTDRAGGIDGRLTPITFGGSEGLLITAMAKEQTSDEVAMPVQAGLWYLQQSYTSQEYLYAYDADGVFRVESPDQLVTEEDAFRKGAWVGNAYRVDVLTTDPRPVVVCWGDSITQGAHTIPLSGNRYPALLGGLINRPVLNLGVNGDQAKYCRYLMRTTVDKLDGVDTVVFLMGINDIIGGGLTDPAEYIKNVTAIAADIRKAGLKCYLGTITPAGGYPKFDADPAKEILRQTINDWIRTQAEVDGVIDYDAALRDPADPIRLLAAYQADWLHPNDAGAQVMAKAAAAVLQ